MSLTDSAGTPWAGRAFHENTNSDDDGSAPPALLAAVARFRAGACGEAAVIDAVRDSRLLVPLIAELGESGTNAHGQTVDKSQELSIVTVVGPDGRNVLPAFSSVDAMRAWNPKARPVPVDAVRIALAAASEQTDLVVLDPTAPGEFVIRRPALWSIAQSLHWTPCYLDEAVLDAFADAARGVDAVRSVSIAPGDPESRFAGPELVVRLMLAEGLDRPSLDAVIAGLQERWSRSELIANRVDSMRLQLVSAA